MLRYNIPKSRRNVLVHHVHYDCLGHTIDITDTFFLRSVTMVLNVISKQKVVKLVEICEQYLGVTVNTRDELDICLLSSCLVPMRDK